jgi:stage II sporulation protein Q
MMKRSAKYYLLSGILIAVLGVTLLISYAITNALTENRKEKENLTYVSSEILTDNIIPTLKEETTTGTNSNSNIMRPYTDSTVKIGKSYYDSKAESNNQEESIIYYKDTYIQNTGVDYTSKKVFDIVSIANGKVISITQDDIVGTTIKIEHDNNLISIYQSVKDVEVKEEDEVTQGQIIAKSGTNSISSDLGNHLHFELYNQTILVNPEDFFQNNEGN